MSVGQIVVGGGLIVILLALAGLYGWRQWQHLRLPAEATEEARFFRRQAWRRLINSGLLLILAGLLFGAMVWLEEPARQLAEQTEQSSAEEWTPEQKALAKKLACYWIVLLLVLFAVIMMAGLDYLATRAYRFKQLRQLEEERRDLMRDMAARVRRERLESN